MAVDESEVTHPPSSSLDCAFKVPVPQIKHFPREDPRRTDAVVDTAVDAADSRRSSGEFHDQVGNVAEKYL
jgi:hypothetical protein